MRPYQLSSHSARVRAALLLVAGAAAWITPTAQAAAAGWPGAASPASSPAASFTVSGGLAAVAATSARNAWAVGSASNGMTLIAHWDGTAWKRVPSPAGRLSGVAATSARSAWAVGCTNCSGTGTPRSLILHWDGTAWIRVPTSIRGGLSGVVATSARSAWAVGYISAGKTLILRWNGTVWKRVPSPSPARGGGLSGVAATSARSAWAVGTAFSHTLIERWNGQAWRRVPSPNPSKDLSNGPRQRGRDARRQAPGRSVTSAAGADPALTLILRWNGTAVEAGAQPLPPGGGAFLDSIAAVSTRSAWAVGATGGGDGPTKTLVLHWNGIHWTRVPSPSPRASASLAGPGRPLRTQRLGGRLHRDQGPHQVPDPDPALERHHLEVTSPGQNSMFQAHHRDQGH